MITNYQFRSYSNSTEKIENKIRYISPNPDSSDLKPFISRINMPETFPQKWLMSTVTTFDSSIWIRQDYNVSNLIWNIKMYCQVTRKHPRSKFENNNCARHKNVVNEIMAWSVNTPEIDPSLFVIECFGMDFCPFSVSYSFPVSIEWVAVYKEDYLSVCLCLSQCIRTVFKMLSWNNNCFSCVRSWDDLCPIARDRHSQNC